MNAATKLSPLLDRLLPHARVRVTFWDGSVYGPDDAPARIVVRSKDALRRIAQCPGELGFGRAYVAGDLDVDGDIYTALDLRDVRENLELGPREKLTAVRAAISLGAFSLRRIPPPPEEP